MRKNINIIKCIVMMVILFQLHTVLAVPIITNNVPKIDKNQTANLTITFLDTNQNALSNAKFKIYKIADISEIGVYTTVDRFKEYNFTYDYQDQQGWNELLDSVSECVKANEIAFDNEIYTNEYGIAKLENMDLGLYFVSTENLVVGAKTYIPQDFFVSLPDMQVQDVWEYNVNIYPKYTLDVDMSKITDKRVIKRWVDEGYTENRPKEVKISLLKNGILYDEIILNEENNWTYIWKDLDDTYDWSVVEELNEQERSKYKSEVTYQGDVFYVTNTYLIELPNTGQLWWPVPVLIGSGLVLIAISIVCRRRKLHE